MNIDSLRAKTISLFYILLAILPFALAIIVSAYHYYHYFYFRTEFLLVVLFGFGLLILISRNGFTSNTGEIAIVAIVVLLAVVIRWVAIIFFNAEPVSDFQNTIELAKLHLEGPFKDLYSARFPYWGFYILTLTSFFRIAGSTISEVRLLNILLSGLTTMGVYYLGRKVTNSRRIAFIASLVYAFWPAEIIYKSLPTGEHIFSLLFPYACLSFLSAIQLFDLNIKRGIAYLLLSGLMLGLMDLYRPVAIVLLIAFGIAILLMRYSSHDDSPKFPAVKSSLFRIALIVGLVFPYWAVKETGYLLVQHEAMAPTNKYGFGSTLRVGLDPELNGRYSREIQSHIRTLMEDYDENYQEVNTLLIRETTEIIKKHSASDYLNLFSNKFCFAWCSEAPFYGWVTKKQIDNGLTSFYPLIFRIYANPASDAYLLFLLFFSSIGSLHFAFHRKDDKSLSIGLFVFGFSLLLLLSEVQPRYRSVLFSSIPIFAAYGISASSQSLSYLRHLIPTAHQKTA